MFVDDREAWQAIVAERGGPVVQDWDWGASREARGQRVWRLTDDGGLALQAVDARWHGLPVAWAAGGPLLGPGGAPRDLGRRLRRMSCQLRRPLVLAPHGWGGPDRPSGCPGLPAGAYLPATVVVDLSGGADAVLHRLHGSWRNQYRSGERRCARLEVGHDAIALARVAALFRLGSGGRAPDIGEPELRALAQAFGSNLELSVAHDKGEDGDVGAAVVLRGSAQALLLGLVTTPAGRGRNGANLLVFEAMAGAATAGLGRFDLGGITGPDDGIAHFKLRTNGVVVENAAPFAALPVPW
ncbi:MAG: peptidoglycan bridge formation glycyltransferase FemA/FemB family protein [Actinomycetia bacterium]|nr:peptidoglycan bridge formation glycyltransferase FemA/FemB family protein [Actinomycetes bacterium]